MDTSPSALWREKADAVKLREDYIGLYADRLSKWCGNRYRKAWKTKPQLENYQAAYIAFMLPQLVSDSPTLKVAPSSDARDTANAEGMQAILNHFIKCTEYRRTVIEPMALALMIGWGVTYRYLDMGSPDAARGMPVVSKAIAIGDYFCDAQAYGYDARRLEGHTAERSKDELLADPLYEQAWPLIANLQTNSDPLKREDLPSGVNKDVTARKDMVTLVHFYVRATGEMITLADSGGPVELRREKYDGPPDGPYQLWGDWEVPGQVYPLPALAASEEQQDDLNDHANAASKAARAYKKYVTGRKGNGDDAKTAQTVKAGQMALFSDPESIKEVESGGMSEVQSQTLELLRARVDRNLGFSDAQRGQATGAATLGENELAQNNADWRTKWLQGRIIALITSDLEAVGWFFFNKQEVVTDMVTENAQGQQESKRFYGGQFSADDVQGVVQAGMADPAAMYGLDREWAEYHLTIDPESMVRVADPVRQKRAQDEMQMAFTFSQLLVTSFGPQAPFTAINWNRLFRRYGDAFNQAQYDQVFFTPIFGQMCAPDALAQMPMQPGIAQGMQYGQQPSMPMGGPQQMPGAIPPVPQPQAPMMPQLPPGQTSPMAVRQGAVAGVAA